MTAGESGSGKGKNEGAEKGGVKTSPEHPKSMLIAATGGDPGGKFVLKNGKLLLGVAVHGEPHPQSPFGGGRFELGDWEDVAVWIWKGKTDVVFLDGRVAPAFGGPFVVDKPKT